jgi:hypothetical protein
MKLYNSSKVTRCIKVLLKNGTKDEIFLKPGPNDFREDLMDIDPAFLLQYSQWLFKLEGTGFSPSPITGKSRSESTTQVEASKSKEKISDAPVSVPDVGSNVGSNSALSNAVNSQSSKPTVVVEDAKSVKGKK